MISVTITEFMFHIQNALAVDERITPLGRALSNLPVEITIGKMLLMGCVFTDVEKILTLAAALSVQNPFTSRAYNDTMCAVSINLVRSMNSIKIKISLF